MTLSINRLLEADVIVNTSIDVAFNAAVAASSGIGGDGPMVNGVYGASAKALQIGAALAIHAAAQMFLPVMTEEEAMTIAFIAMGVSNGVAIFGARKITQLATNAELSISDALKLTGITEFANYALGSNFLNSIHIPGESLRNFSFSILPKSSFQLSSGNYWSSWWSSCTTYCSKFFCGKVCV